jgi:ribonuclease HI
MGSSSTEGLRGVEAVFDRFNNSNPTFIRDPITSICGCFPCCG